MTWIKLNDNAPRHPKVAGLSDKAFRAWVLSLCYASEFLTDGWLPPAFLSTVPRKVRTEIEAAGLWRYGDGTTTIHDYLKHQNSKGAVEKERQRNIDRRTGGRTGGTTAGRTSEKPRPEYRDQSTEIRDQSTTPPPASSYVGGGRLITTGRQWEKLMESHAFVGAKLKVPKVLHTELVAKSGKDGPAVLLEWYQRLDSDLEASDMGTGDVFAWLRPRHQVFAVDQGWIAAAPPPKKPVPKYRGVAEILAEAAAKKARPAC